LKVKKAIIEEEFEDGLSEEGMDNVYDNSEMGEDEMILDDEMGEDEMMSMDEDESEEEEMPVKK